MYIREVSLGGVDFIDPHTLGDGRNPRVTFRIQTTEQTFDMSVLLDADTDDEQIVPVARAKLHAILRALADHTQSWAQS